MQKAVPTDELPFGRIHVLFTNPGDTRAALKTAIAMASELDTEISLIVTQVVPFPLPLDDAPVPVDFAEEQVRRLADSLCPGSIELRAFVYLCRNPLETIIRKLPTHSLIVVGTRPHWPFGESKHLARALRRNGHAVILAKHG